MGLAKRVWNSPRSSHGSPSASTTGCVIQPYMVTPGTRPPLKPYCRARSSSWILFSWGSIHAGALPWAVKAVAEYFKGRIHPGDMYLLNDPYHGGNHLPDLTALLPVFVGERLAFWSINRAHQSDIGGATHGAYNPGATEIWQEGIRITPLKLYDAGVLRDDVMDMIATNVRHPRDFLGDLRAMMGSARVGERRLLKLIDDYGAETATEAVGEVRDSAERQSRACIRQWKDGVYRGVSILDDDGHGIEDIGIRATVTKKGDALIVDLTQCDPQ